MMLKLVSSRDSRYLFYNSSFDSCGGSGSSDYLSLQKNITENMKLIAKQTHVHTKTYSDYSSSYSCGVVIVLLVVVVIVIVVVVAV